MARIPFPIVPYPPMQPPAHRDKPMKVLALGMPRTGTLSLYVALKKLGYNCYHMAECSLDQRNGSLGLWTRAINAKYNGDGRKFSGRDFDQMLWRYDAVVDIPCILFAEELMDAYPDAQIVLTTRPTYIGLYIPILRSALSVWTGRNWQDTSCLPIGFTAHHDQVHAAARAHGRKVLEFMVQDGWGPLCQFLGREAPNEPFPHVNEVRLAGVAKQSLIWATPVVAGGAAWWYFRKHCSWWRDRFYPDEVLACGRLFCV
ncbi:hypothetical protein BDV37DRAFT_272855 [Aspergillus pseudonomiae]|uniref:P-loop containing nucleoside triphosphate hydrolase protein n=1 Tax=Aspergillus pseudonomiae TaxID=1506151 RepID=A0A5N7D7G6_9EURO|nr:uncharacterized protein BDV37DRAFT_272855 [Aspergillus pseudonomiae]KAE8402382.1 hypothetical protein BDV37DRAFT_272855 [Aspergillus pseudonomiae]